MEESRVENGTDKKNNEHLEFYLTNLFQFVIRTKKIDGFILR